MLGGCAAPSASVEPARGALGVFEPPAAALLVYDDAGAGLAAVVESRQGDGWRWAGAGETVATLRRVGLAAARAEARTATRAAQDRLVSVETKTQHAAQLRWVERQRIEAERADAQAAVDAWERGGRSDAYRESELAVRELALGADRLEQEYAALPEARRRADPDDADSAPTREARLLREAWSILQAKTDIEGHRHERRLNQGLPANGEELERNLRAADVRLGQLGERHAMEERRDAALMAEARRDLDTARADASRLNALDDTVKVQAPGAAGWVRVVVQKSARVEPGEVVASYRATASGTVIVAFGGGDAPEAGDVVRVRWLTLDDAETTGRVRAVEAVVEGGAGALARIEAAPPVPTAPPPGGTPVRVRLGG